AGNGASSQSPNAKVLLALLVRLVQPTRELLLKTSDLAGKSEQWNGELRLSLMMFDLDEKKLIVVKGARFVNKDKTERVLELDYSHVAFGYGDGIAGKAFKANRYRLYIQLQDQQRGPTSFRTLPQRSNPSVLLSIPLRAPSENARPYGVINISSKDVNCPLI